MTIDDVVMRTGTTLGVLIVTAALSWALLPVDDANISRSYGIGIGAALIGMVLALVQSFKRKPTPALILTYAAFEGVFLGVISNIVDNRIADGAAMQAVIGTMAVFAGVLVAYKARLDPRQPPLLRLRDGGRARLRPADGREPAVRGVRRR